MEKKAPQNPDQPQTPQLKEGRNSWGSLMALCTPCPLEFSARGCTQSLPCQGYERKPKRAQHGDAAASEQTRAQGNSMLMLAKVGNRFPDGPLYVWLQ